MASAQQASTPGQTVVRMNATVPHLSVAAGRKGFKAELEELRERMHRLGLGHEQIAGEIARRYRGRPREAHRLAHGWTLGQAAARFNACAAERGCDPDGLASLTASRLCEYEKWPQSQRRPSVYVLVMLAIIYQTGVLNLLDLADHEHLPPHDRLGILQPEPPARSGPHSLTPARAAPNTGYPDAPPPPMLPAQQPANAQGISLSLPYVPGRVVIEVTDLAAPLGDVTVPTITALRGQPPVPGAVVPAAVSHSRRAPEGNRPRGGRNR